jgi:hypothetical protein
MFRSVLILNFCIAMVTICAAQTQPNTTSTEPKYDYQIYLKKPARQVQELLNEKDCTPMNGHLSEDGKTVILKDYPKQGAKVHVKVVYEDGSDDDFVRSPCFIDPIIL